MSKVYPAIDDRLRAFIEAQKMFFVGTAPSGDDGHINLSPKGLESFRVLGPHQVAYLDYLGSGAETIAHLRENGRIVIMFCAFEGPPNIVRLHGVGRVLEPQDQGFAELAAQFLPDPDQAAATGARSIIAIDVERVSDSCGYGVPRYTYRDQRPQLPAWVDRKSTEAIVDYQIQHNRKSIDGLPALRWTEENGKNQA